MKVYLDNGATTKVADEVVEAMKPYFTEKYGNASSLHSFGTEAREAVEKSRKIIANYLGCDGSEIIFTSGGSESDNLAIKGVAEKGDHIITSKIEHPAVLNVCKFLEKNGVEVTYLKVDKEGLIDLNELKNSIKKNTKLVSIMHANNEIGTIQDIEKIGKICKENKVLFHTDAVQSFSNVKIPIENIDMISISGHKIHGPKGVGALFVRKGIKLKQLIIGGSQEFNVRAGTENVPGIVGLGKAVELLKHEKAKLSVPQKSQGDFLGKEDAKKIEKLRDKLIEGVLKIPHSRLNGSKDKRLPNNVNVSFDFVEGEALILRLDDKGIAASTGSACSSHSLEPSHVLLAIGLKPAQAHGSLRLTLSRYTTEKEIDYVLKELPNVVEDLRRISPLGRR
jgi:cysteine desulfurase